MKRVMILLVLFICAGSQAFSKIPPEHLACENDDDCALVSRGGCCGAEMAINKEYVDRYELPRNKKCNEEKHACRIYSAQCVEGQCFREEIPKYVQ